MRPPPPTRYGRMPPPRVPPIGTPTMTLPITSITLLLPNWPDGPKKLGFHPKSTSPPTTPPAPMAPPLPPNGPRPSWMLLPNPEPTHGLENPAGGGGMGASTTAAAALSTSDLMMCFIAVHSSSKAQGASDMP